MSDTAALLVYATRYALGRRTYAVLDVVDAIHEATGLDRGTLQTLARDIEECQDYGSRDHAQAWRGALDELRKRLVREGSNP